MVGKGAGLCNLKRGRALQFAYFFMQIAEPGPFSLIWISNKCWNWFYSFFSFSSMAAYSVVRAFFNSGRGEAQVRLDRIKAKTGS